MSLEHIYFYAQSKSKINSKKGKCFYFSNFLVLENLSLFVYKFKKKFTIKKWLNSQKQNNSKNKKKLKAKIIEKFEQRKVQLQNIFLKYDSPPFFVEDKFDPLEMSQYFNEYFHA